MRLLVWSLFLFFLSHNAASINPNHGLKTSFSMRASSSVAVMTTENVSKTSIKPPSQLPTKEEDEEEEEEDLIPAEPKKSGPKNLLEVPLDEALRLVLGVNTDNDEPSFLTRLFGDDDNIVSKERPIPALSSLATWDAQYDPKGNIIEAHGVRQWTLVKRDTFDWNALGWNNEGRSKCAGISMLGGYKKFSSGKLVKNFTNLPTDHNEIRLVATIHFIDQWAGESVLVRMENSLDQSMLSVFTHRHTEVGNKKFGVNLCGGRTPEGKFSVPVDVFIPHRGPSIKVEFSTTLDESVDPKEASFGVSSVELYVR